MGVRARALVAGSVAATVVVAAAAGAAWVWADRMVHPRPSASTHLADFQGLVAEDVTFDSRTGVRLAGRFFAGSTPATIVLTHGYGGSQDEMLPVADMLVGAGFSVLTYDSRGMGASGGRPTLGKLETLDLQSAIDYVAARRDVDPDRIGALGHSTGGATTVMAAAADPRIRAVVTDSGWSDVRDWLRPSARASFHGVTPLAWLGLRALEIRTGVHLADLRPVGVIHRIAPRPLLIIHGERDAIVPPAGARVNFAAAGAGRDLWLVPGAGHGDTVGLRDPRYADRVTSFFAAALV